MDIQHSTNEELQLEILELRQEIKSLKALLKNGNAVDGLCGITSETSSRLEMALQGGNMAWWEMDLVTGNVIFAKRKAEMLGYAPEKFKKYTDFTDLVHPSDYERIMRAMKGHFEEVHHHYEAEYRILAKSGEYIWFYDYGTVVKKDPDGKPLIITGFVYDITDRKKVEERLLFINKAVEATSDVVGISDKKGHHFYQNKAFSDLFGYETVEETAAAGSVPAFVKDAEMAGEIFGNSMKGIPWSGEVEMVTKAGRVFPAFQRVNAIFNSAGDISGIIAVINDITFRKQNEESLAKSDLMLQSVLDHFPGIVFWKDRQSNYLGCNQSFASGAGLNSTTEIVGKTDFEMPWASTEAINYIKDDIEVMECGIGKLHLIETQHQSDSRVIWLDTSKLPLRNTRGHIIGVIGLSNDISMLKSAEQKLIITNNELLIQNEEKDKLAAELIIAKDKAEASDRLKTAFMNNISHEIRTPLNSILGFAPFIIEPDITMEEKEEYLETLKFSSNRLMNTITDIMDISLIISGNMKVHPQPIDVSSLLKYVFKSFQSACAKKNLDFKLQFPNIDHPIIITTDGEILRKAVFKLVDNAVKFTKTGSVTLGFELINNKIEIFVRDTGIGIEKDAQELIYKHFIQEDSSMTRSHEGNGLGLSIANGAIQLLGGDIRLESSKNVGTTVFLILPFNTIEASSIPTHLINIIKAEGIPYILIVEDDDSNYCYIETLLRKDNKTVRACSGKEAVDLCKKHPGINLVLMNIQMPVMNGIEATCIIKSFRKDLPIIAITALAQSGDEFRIKEAGCDDYLSIPINKTKLLSLIKKYFRQ